MSRCREIQILGYAEMFREKQEDAYSSRTRAGSHRLLLKMTPIGEAAAELADSPFSQVKSVISAPKIYCWEGSAWTDPTVETRTCPPLLPVLEEFTGAHGGQGGMAFTRASTHTARPKLP